MPEDRGAERLLADAQDPGEMYKVLTDFYKDYGVGKYGLHRAFKIVKQGEETVIAPITRTEKVTLNDLVGYEIQKKKLVDNTLAFVQGQRANNVLLFGDSGTGKSTSIKAILNEYYKDGLRMVEIYKHQFKDIPDVIAQIKNRNYRYILYMDDLSFEEFEIEYKYLKAVIEGGLETKPDNVLIYATSNRRHLIRETWGGAKAKQRGCSRRGFYAGKAFFGYPFRGNDLLRGSKPERVCGHCQGTGQTLSYFYG